MVAKLPFEPFSLLSKLTNRGLAELNDSRACAWVRSSLLRPDSHRWLSPEPVRRLTATPVRFKRVISRLHVGSFALETLSHGICMALSWQSHLIGVVT